MADFTTRDKVALLKDFLNVVGTETEGVEVKVTRDADNGMRFYAEPQVLIDVKNDSGAQIDKGTPVYVSGEHGGSGKPTIEKAKADAAATMPAIGLLLTDLADEAEGYVLAAGTLLNLDTDTPAWDAGDALYVSPTTAGDMTKTRPTGDTQLVQKVALVARRHASSGSVIVMGAGRTNDTPNDSYSGRYDTEAETARSGATTTTEIYYTARPDGDGYAESEVTTSTPAGAVIERRLYYSDKFAADPDTSGDWTLYTTQPADDTAFATAKASLLAGLSDTDGTANTRGTLPVSLKMEHQFTTDLLLEDYPGAEAAYSVRKISGAYTGYAIRIREDSGNTETDIGFDSNGDLDTAAIASHCGANNGYVVTWYDQSGNGNHATQGTAASQPLIYNGTAVITKNGRPAAQFDGSDDNLGIPNAAQPANINNCSAFAVFAPNNGAALELSTGSTSKWLQPFGWFIPDEYFGYGNANGAIGKYTVTQDAQRILTAIAGSTQGNLQVYSNGISQGSTALVSAVPQSGTASIGGVSTNSLEGHFQEAIIYHSDQFTNRIAIESDIDTYYGVSTQLLLDTYSGAAAAYSVRKLSQWYTGNCMKVRRDSDDTTQDIGFDSNGDLDTAAIAAFCTTANGYVDTWYDQSGNGNDATQSTTTQQPQIYNGTAVLTRNGKPAPDFDGSNDFLTFDASTVNQPFTWFGVAQRDDTTNSVVVGWNVFSFIGRYEANDFSIFANSYLGSSSFNSTAQQMFYGLFNTTSSELAVNGGTAVTGNVNTRNMTGSGNIGADSNGGNDMQGSVQELILWPSNQSSNRTGIESNINTYYSVY